MPAFNEVTRGVSGNVVAGSLLYKPQLALVGATRYDISLCAGGNARSLSGSSGRKCPQPLRSLGLRPRSGSFEILRDGVRQPGSHDGIAKGGLKILKGSAGHVGQETQPVVAGHDGRAPLVFTRNAAMQCNAMRESLKAALASSSNGNEVATRPLSRPGVSIRKVGLQPVGEADFDVTTQVGGGK